jgi:hypothetical protein
MESSNKTVFPLPVGAKLGKDTGYLTVTRFIAPDGPTAHYLA